MTWTKGKTGKMFWQIIASPQRREAGKLPREAMLAQVLKRSRSSRSRQGLGNDFFFFFKGSWTALVGLQASNLCRAPSHLLAGLSPDSQALAEIRRRPGGRGGGGGSKGAGAAPGFLAGLARRAHQRTDLPGGAVPQHDDFQLPVQALLLRVRHGVPGTRPAYPPSHRPHPREIEEGREGGGSPGAGERRNAGSGDRTPPTPGPGVSEATGSIREESLAGRHLARRPAP